jgi:hypothetical protein
MLDSSSVFSVITHPTQAVHEHKTQIAVTVKRQSNGKLRTQLIEFFFLPAILYTHNHHYINTCDSLSIIILEVLWFISQFTDPSSLRHIIHVICNEILHVTKYVTT